MFKRLAVVGLACGLLAFLAITGLGQVKLQAQEPVWVKQGPPVPVTGVDADDSMQSVRQPEAFPYKSYNSGDFFFPPYEAGNERMGYDLSLSFDTTPLKAGWYTDWGTRYSPAHPGGVEYVQTIYFNIKDTGKTCTWYNAPATQRSQVSAASNSTIIRNAQANPGSVWVIGNEPDSIYNGSPLQAELYAELYHEYYTLIKSADPTAKVAIGGVVQPSPLRMEYLDKVLTHYQTTYGSPMPVDLWNIHLYILNEQSCGWGSGTPPFINHSGWVINFTAAELLDVYDDVPGDTINMEYNLLAFRQWMNDRGYGNIPLIVTEFGVLPPSSYSGFSNTAAASFLTDIFDLLRTQTDPTVGYAADGGRLVQAWAWYSTRDANHGYGGNLFKTDGSLTVIGDAFVAETTAAYTSYVDLQVVPPLGGLLNDTSINAYVNNMGNLTATNVTVAVTLTHGLSQTVVDTATFSIPELGTRYNHTPAFIDTAGQIQSPGSGKGFYTVTVAASHAVSETNTTNNATSQAVLWYPELALTQFDAPAFRVFSGSAPLPTVVSATIQNTGNWTSTTATVQFDLQRATGTDWQTATVPVLTPGQSAVVTVTWPISPAGHYVLTATVNPANNTDWEFNFDNNQMAQSLDVVNPADLEISKTGPATAAPGSRITYTLTLTNHGAAVLPNVVITDAIPAAGTYITGGTRLGGEVQWILPQVDSHSTDVVTFALTATTSVVNRDYGFSVDDTIFVAGTRPVVTLTGGDQTLALRKTGPEAGIAGAPITYTLRLTNISPVDLHAIVITDALPAGATWLRGGSLNGGVVSWTVPSLAADGGFTQTTLVVTATQTITNQHYGASAENGLLTVTGQEAVVTVLGHSVPVDPGARTIIITDTPGISVTQFLTIEIPAANFAPNTTLSYTELPLPPEWLITPQLGFEDVMFRVDAYAGGSIHLPDLTLVQPMTITLRYTDTFAGNELGMGIYFYDETLAQWRPATETCSPGSLGTFVAGQDAAKNLLWAHACQLGKFALLQTVHPVYLPLILR